MNSPIDYEQYLGLPAILAAATPLTSPDKHPAWAAERYFIACHQVSELWVDQVFISLHLCAHLLEHHNPHDACRAANRARACFVAAIDSLDGLEQLEPTEFASFRPQLMGMSGFQSAQFERLLGPQLRTDLDHLRAAIPDTPDPHHNELRAHLDAIETLPLQWRLAHLALVRRFLNLGQPGTGGSDGIAFLADRLNPSPTTDN